LLLQYTKDWLFTPRALLIVMMMSITGNITVQSECGLINEEIQGLLALETRIENVPEWPFDMNSFSRVILYLLLGLGSWVGAALVERLLENTW
jgi:hypothetical protein